MQRYMSGFWIHVNKRLTNNVADILIIFTKVGVPFKIPLGVKIDSFEDFCVGFLNFLKQFLNTYSILLQCVIK